MEHRFVSSFYCFYFETKSLPYYCYCFQVFDLKPFLIISSKAFDGIRRQIRIHSIVIHYERELFFLFVCREKQQMVKLIRLKRITKVKWN